MNVTLLRNLARKGGVPGLLVAGLYVTARGSWSHRGIRTAALTFIAALCIVTLFPDVPSAPPTAAAPAYDIVDLGTAGEGVIITTLNARGDAAGAVMVSERVLHAAVWRGGKITDIGTLGGSLSLATGMNDRGEVVGQSEAGSRRFLGFRWLAGKMAPLPSLNNGASSARCINGAGIAGGFSTSRPAAVVGCRWEGGRCRALPQPDRSRFSMVLGLNDAGDAAGIALGRSMETANAVAWCSGAARVLKTLGGKSAMAQGISQRGVIVGASQLPGGDDAEWHAALWQGETVRDLGKLPGMAWAVASGVNAVGDIVGASGVG